MNIGIVGHEARKFTPETEARARTIIRGLLSPSDTLVSGHCPLGGIDVWAEEEAAKLRIMTRIFPPKYESWEAGYKPRNIQIAEHSDIVFNLVVAQYPPEYNGMRFDYCYHCHTSTHIKSGGCWTAKYAQRLGKPAEWVIL